jgi:hypothetical protein
MGKIAQNIALAPQRVGVLGDRECLAGKPLRLGLLASARVDERLCLPP